MLTLVFWHGAWCYGFKCKQANKHRTEKQSPGFTFTLCIMSKYSNTTNITLVQVWDNFEIHEAHKNCGTLLPPQAHFMCIL